MSVSISRSRIEEWRQKAQAIVLSTNAEDIVFELLLILAAKDEALESFREVIRGDEEV